MLARLALVVLPLVVAAAASADPLIGSWRSDRDLTLVEVGKLATLTLEQREVLSAADLLDQLIAIYANPEIDFQLAGSRARFSQQIVATGSDFVAVEYGDEGTEEPVRARLSPHEGLLYVPVEDLGFHEAFGRAGVPAAPAP